MASHNRIPSLDGLRAVSIGLVLLAHVRDIQQVAGSKFAESLSYLNPGTLGVQVFFVISGFLITGLLIGEAEKTGTISLRRFYFRRTLRIFPAFYVFLITLALLLSFNLLPLQPTEHPNLLPAALYVSNWFDTGTWYAGHSWSLSVEEQFYVLFPLLFLWVVWRRPRALIYFLLATAVLRTIYAGAIALKFVTYLPIVGGTTHFDAIAVGCLLALYRDRLRESPIYLGLVKRIWPLVVGLLALRAALLPGINLRLAVFLSFGAALSSILIALIIDAAVTKKVWVLNTRPLVYVGTLSYSIYLWQQLFLSPPSTWSWPAALLGVAFVSLVSHYLVERPMLRLRRRMERRTSPLVAPENLASL